MSFFMIVGLAVGLAMDALAVSIGVSISLRGATPRQIFRLSFHFGLFQGMMPILGWISGNAAAAVTARISHWTAFCLLLFIGGRAIWNALREESAAEKALRDPTRGLSLIMLSLATSMDAFVVGVSFAMLAIRVWYPALVIGVITGSLTVLGMIFGGFLGRRFGKIMEVVGGAVLIGIGIKALLDGL